MKYFLALILLYTTSFAQEVVVVEIDDESFKLIPEISAPRAPDNNLISIKINILLDVYFVKMYKY